MAYIYQITNDINQKIYIGKTEFSIGKRFKEHCSDAFRERNEKRPLYNAMRKYGVEHFHIELIEETDNPEEREIYWIEKKQSFKNGYNATIGGDGRKYIDYDLVIATYQELKNISEVSRHLNIHPDTISRILKDSNEKIYSASEVGQFYYGKLIKQLDSNTGELIQIFPSVRAAAKFLRPDSSSVGGVVSHITDVCKGKRNMAYGYKWEFVNKTS